MLEIWERKYWNLVNKNMEENKEKEKEITVVTVRCIDMVAPHIDSWKRVCSMCGFDTWISASWKDKRIDRIVCEPCYLTNYKDRDDVNICVTEKNIDEFLEWTERYYGKRSTREEAIRFMELKLSEWKKTRVGIKKIKIVKSSEE